MILQVLFPRALLAHLTREYDAAHALKPLAVDMCALLRDDRFEMGLIWPRDAGFFSVLLYKQKDVPETEAHSWAQWVWQQRPSLLCKLQEALNIFTSLELFESEPEAAAIWTMAQLATAGGKQPALWGDARRMLASTHAAVDRVFWTPSVEPLLQEVWSCAHGVAVGTGGGSGAVHRFAHGASSQGQPCFLQRQHGSYKQCVGTHIPVWGPCSSTAVSPALYVMYITALVCSFCAHCQQCNMLSNICSTFLSVTLRHVRHLPARLERPCPTSPTS